MSAHPSARRSRVVGNFPLRGSTQAIVPGGRTPRNAPAARCQGFFSIGAYADDSAAMRFLRTVSTRRLLALCAGVIAAAAGGTAIALAAAGGGPAPPPKPLARAVHDALAAPSVQGVSARIHFTNHLVDQGVLGEGADPILTGASGRLWAAPDGRLRVELQ